ncbi:uncharacterized protein LOC142339883 isoform X2 [Convolutriloba macropyga]|uniref:uncharacterized protein LOC142339883 isoform X2 n=1 Tax=Convolutriloba macropyga TaxID=536237 RepID=UPI003F51FCF1
MTILTLVSFQHFLGLISHNDIMHKLFIPPILICLFIQTNIVLCLDTPLYLEECPCLIKAGPLLERVTAPRLSTCYAYCVVKRCYALRYSAAFFICELFSVDSVGYTTNSVNTLNCNANPSEGANSGYKWYLRTSGATEETADCVTLQSRYPTMKSGWTSDVKVRGFQLSHYCRMNDATLKTMAHSPTSMKTRWSDSSDTQYLRQGYWLRIEFNGCLIRGHNYEDPSEWWGDTSAAVGSGANFVHNDKPFSGASMCEGGGE